MDKLQAKLTELADAFRWHYNVNQKLPISNMFDLSFGISPGTTVEPFPSVEDAFSMLRSGIDASDDGRMTIQEMIDAVKPHFNPVTLVDQERGTYFRGKSFDITFPKHKGIDVKVVVTMTTINRHAGRVWTVALSDPENSSATIQKTTDPLSQGFSTLTIELRVPATSTANFTTLSATVPNADSALSRIKAVVELDDSPVHLGG